MNVDPRLIFFKVKVILSLVIMKEKAVLIRLGSSAVLILDDFFGGFFFWGVGGACCQQHSCSEGKFVI